MRAGIAVMAALGILGVVAAYAPASAHEDDHDCWRRQEWREHQGHEWREQQEREEQRQRWREHEWRERAEQNHAQPQVYYARPPTYYSAPAYPPAYGVPWRP
jgi:hypothetical protein